MILLLEDDADRLSRFAAVPSGLAPGMELRAWRDAHATIREGGQAPRRGLRAGHAAVIMR